MKEETMLRYYRIERIMNDLESNIVNEIIDEKIKKIEQVLKEF